MPKKPLALVITTALSIVSLGALSIDTETHLRQRVEQGDAAARLNLADYYTRLGQRDAALAELRTAAEMGSAPAHRLLAEDALRVQDGDDWFARAQAHLEQADRLGDERALVDLGIAHALQALADGRSREQRMCHAQAVERLLVGPAARGDTDAAWHLGYMMTLPTTPLRNLEAGVGLIERASTGGHPVAAYWMARHLLSQQQGSEALPHLERAALAGHRLAMQTLATQLSLGKALPKDKPRAAYWREQLRATTSSQPAPIAASGRARIDLEPPAITVPDLQVTAGGRTLAPALIEAAAYATTATPAPDEDAPAMVPAAELERVKRELAITRQALDEVSIERDQLRERLRVVEGELAALFAMRSALRDAEALNQQGLALYARGDFEGALPLFRAAHEAHHAGATANLGLLYLNGKAVPQDIRQAERLLARAAEQGNLTAAENLAQMYDQGIGVHHDPSRAIQWYERAVALGSAEARDKLDLLRAQ